MKHLFSLLLAATFLCFCIQAFAQTGEKFDLNNATIEQLMLIPGANITKDMAKAMIAKGKAEPFTLPEDLLKIPGFDNRTLEAINPVEQNGSLWYDPDNTDMFLAPSKC